MFRYIFLLVFGWSTVALAAEPDPRVMLQVVTAQRNQLMDMLAQEQAQTFQTMQYDKATADALADYWARYVGQN